MVQKNKSVKKFYGYCKFFLHFYNAAKLQSTVKQLIEDIGIINVITNYELRIMNYELCIMHYALWIMH